MYNEYNTPLGVYIRKKGCGGYPIRVTEVRSRGVNFSYVGLGKLSATSEARYFNWKFFNANFKREHVTPEDKFMEVDF